MRMTPGCRMWEVGKSNTGGASVVGGFIQHESPRNFGGNVELDLV